MIEDYTIPDALPEEEELEIQPTIQIDECDDSYGKFIMEPLERGYAITLGTPIRRTLLNSIPGTAITWVKIDGVLHEYGTLPNIKEEVMDIILNTKGVRIKPNNNRPGKMRLEVNGEGEVCAGDISTSSDFEIVNPELHLLSLDSKDASIEIEFNVEQGKGFQIAKQQEGLPVGVLPIDAVFNPIKKVNCSVERTRVGQTTDYERLVVEIWTDKTINPVDALKMASNTLMDHFFTCVNVGKEPDKTEEGPAQTHSVPIELFHTSVEKLDLSPRALNCLKRAHIDKVGEILERSREDLLSIRNFGKKSLDELYDKLREMGILENTPTDTDDESVSQIEAEK